MPAASCFVNVFCLNGGNVAHSTLRHETRAAADADAARISCILMAKLIYRLRITLKLPSVVASSLKAETGSNNAPPVSASEEITATHTTRASSISLGARASCPGAANAASGHFSRGAR